MPFKQGESRSDVAAEAGGAQKLIEFWHEEGADQARASSGWGAEANLDFPCPTSYIFGEILAQS